MIKQKKIVYYSPDNVPLEGMLVYPDDYLSKKYPVIMVIHDWTGRDSIATEKAEKIAQLGYVAFAIDMYGHGICGKNNAEKSALMAPLVDNRTLLYQRLQAALTAIRNLPFAVDQQKIGVIGFCFGGLCALDFARNSTEISGIVSFHGLLHAPNIQKLQNIQAKILVLHGYNDPMVTPEQMLSFSTEMTQAKADWQIYLYGNTMHAFTNPTANNPDFGTVYQAVSAQRAWLAMRNFFEEIFNYAHEVIIN